MPRRPAAHRSEPAKSPSHAATPPLTAEDVEFLAVRSQGPGGQHVNTASTAAHLRFDIHRSALPAWLKARLAALADQRITAQGVIVIKAQASRSLDRNKADALARLNALVAQAAQPERPRVPTRPTRGARLRRLKAKAIRSALKADRGQVGE